MGASGSPDSFAAWHLYLLDDGRLRLTWFDSAVETSLTSTIAVPQSTTRRSIRVEHDNFLGSSTATFYTADTFNGSWVQLGEVVTDASTTTQFHTGGSLCVGHVPSESVDLSVKEPLRPETINVKFATGATMPGPLVTVSEAVVVWLADALSVTVSVTV